MKYKWMAIVIATITLSACGSGDTDTTTVEDSTGAGKGLTADEVDAITENMDGMLVAEETPMPEKYKDFDSTASGLRYKIYRNGTGDIIERGDYVAVDYRGTFTSGVQFDASYDRGQPFPLGVGYGFVIPGWDEGLQLLHEGDSAELYIPWQLAYGDRGSAQMPAKSNLVFTIEPKEILYKNDFDFDAYEEKRTQTGLSYYVMEEGDGAMPVAGNNVEVHYTGYFLDGKVFDSSVEKGTPLPFQVGVGAVIPGWDEAVQLMKVGTKMRVIVPFYLAYGEQGYPGAIPPYSNLVFDMELMSTN